MFNCEERGGNESYPFLFYKIIHNKFGCKLSFAYLCTMENGEKIMENLTQQLTMIDSRVGEIKGEIATLDFQMEISKIDARLYRMKRKTLMYELSLIDKKVGEINTDFQINEMFRELGFTLSNKNEI